MPYSNVALPGVAGEIITYEAEQLHGSEHFRQVVASNAGTIMLPLDAMAVYRISSNLEHMAQFPPQNRLIAGFGWAFLSGDILLVYYTRGENHWEPNQPIFALLSVVK